MPKEGQLYSCRKVACVREKKRVYQMNWERRYKETHGNWSTRRYDRNTAKICESCGDVFLTRKEARFCSQKCNAASQDMFERSAQGNAALAEKLRSTLKEQREGGSWAQHSGFVFTRDDYTCWLCGERTSESFSHRDLLSPTLDHVTPRSLGGGHDPENLRTAHWLCNSIRGHREEVVSIDPSRVYERALL